jgi:hypothetical protein
MSISDLPRKRKPASVRAKLKRPRIWAWTWGVKYMRAFRDTSRSTREIGASCTRSLRPKMTERRRSARKVWPNALRSKYLPRRSAGMASSSLCV